MQQTNQNSQRNIINIRLIYKYNIPLGDLRLTHGAAGFLPLIPLQEFGHAEPEEFNTESFKLIRKNTNLEKKNHIIPFNI